MDQTILQMLERTVDRFPNKTFMIVKGQAVTYQTLASEVSRAASRLARLGVKQGDRVCLYLGNRPEFIYLHFGTLKLGAIVVPINVTYRRRELAYIPENSGAKIFVTDDFGWQYFFDAKGELGSVQHTIIVSDKPPPHDSYSYNQLPYQQTTFESVSIKPDDIAAIIYTSGTTGRSKGAMLTHRNFTSNIHDLAQVWKWTSSDRLLLGLPMFHVHGLGVVLHGVVYTGGSLVLMERFDAARALQLISEHRCNVFMGVPTMYSMLLEVEEPLKYDLSHMRLFVSGSAPLPVKVFRNFKEKYGFEIVERYGMTETIMNISNPVEGTRKPGSVGLPLPNVQVKIVDQTGKTAPSKEVGEIMVKGSNVMKGYWNMEDATRETFVDKWFKTGDLGYVDDDGYILITGRKKEMIIISGFKVYPREVEDVLSEHPKVKEAAVIGVSDQLKGERVKAFVVPQPGTPPSEEELIKHCRKILASFKTPSSITIIDTMPRTASGKIIKGALAELTKNSTKP
ncbi:MAG: long-chain fatty acid--CoA ligase [Thaumarchaeota archaeon]|nr:long-chain fatty acid--CoA ligase [Nitrososphaerota archaeon]